MSRCTARWAATAAWLMAGAAGAQPHLAGHARSPVSFPVSCSAPARAQIERGVELLHHMTYPGAREAFDRAARLDSTCTMAQWGVAMTLFQPLWPTRPSAADLRLGTETVRRARAIGARTERERLYVDAADAFFADGAPLDYWDRLRRWSAALGRLHEAVPQDPDASAFYALSLLAVAPADTAANDAAARAAALLLDVYRRNAEHPGAMHYLVHASDAPGRERELLDVTRKYATSAPRNAHALHMPTHIYVRLGEWDKVVHGNLQAALAALEQPAGDRGQFVWDELPHAVEYLVYAYLQQGDDARAATQVRRLWSTARLQPTFKTAFNLASTRARLALERRAWGDAAALVPRDPATLDWDRFPWAEGVTWFARGLGAVHLSRLDSARAAAERLDTLEGAARRAGEDLFARNVRMLSLELRGWIAYANRDTASSTRLLREAAELEERTPKHAVTPAPTLPARELLGDLLLAQGRPSEALAEYRRSLASYPRRFNSLLGAARAAKAAGDGRTARAYYRELLQAAPSSTRRTVREEARSATRP